MIEKLSNYKDRKSEKLLLTHIENNAKINLAVDL